MGNFILVQRNKGIDNKSVLELAAKMHLKEPLRLFCDNYDIWLFDNLNSKTDLNTTFQYYDDWIFAAGTFFYKDFSFTDSLKHFYKDYINEMINKEEMFGHFAILMTVNGVIHIINDSLGCQRIYSTKDRLIISTLFMATWFLNKKPLNINRIAFYEKISTGFIAAPDTLIEDIFDITYEDFNDGIIIKQHFPLTHNFFKSHEDIRFQISALHKYFKKLFTLAQGQTISLGVSGGFDSRVLLSIFKDYPNKYIYTHSTNGIHTQESEIAKKLTDLLHHKLSIKETENAENLNFEEAEALLADLIYYFDSRTANNSGAFSLTGSFDYNYYHLRNVSLGLNGKGGEVYRNHYNIPDKRYTFKKWFTLLECYPSFDFVFTKKLRVQILSNIENKINKRITTEGKKWNRWLIQRYYSEIRQPDCEAAILNAHNKITYYIAPFLDANLLKYAYRSFEKKGSSDWFQRKLIRELSVELAAVNSKYGFNFITKSFKWQLLEWIKRNLPNWYKKKRRKNSLSKIQKRIKPNTHTKAAIDVLAPIFPEINWGNAIIHYAQRNIIIFLAHLIKEAKKYNKLI